jgi:hypothetical protein
MEKDIGGDGWGVWCCSEALTSILHPRAQHAMWAAGMGRQVQGTRCEAKLSCSPSMSAFSQLPLQPGTVWLERRLWAWWRRDAVYASAGPSTSHTGAGEDGVHVQAGAGSGGGRGSYNTIDISAMLFPQRPHRTPDATRLRAELFRRTSWAGYSLTAAPLGTTGPTLQNFRGPLAMAAGC